MARGTRKSCCPQHPLLTDRQRQKRTRTCADIFIDGNDGSHGMCEIRIHFYMDEVMSVGKKYSKVLQRIQNE